MIKKILISLTFLLLYTGVYSQKYFITNQYVYDLFLMNPSAAGFNRSCISINGFYQRQWFGFDLAPTTQLLAVQMPAGKNVGSGTYLYNDRNGNNKKFSAMQAFSVEVKLRENKKGNTSIVFGMGALLEQASIDQSSFDDIGIDPAITGSSESGFGFNANAGLMLRINQYHFGTSITNLFPQNNPMYDSEWEPELSRDIHLHAGTIFKYPGRDLYFEPLLYYRQNSMQDSRLDINLKIDIPTFNEDFSLWGVAAYRRAIDKEFGMSLGAATSVGINYKGFNVGVEQRSLPCSERDHMLNVDTQKPPRKKRGLFRWK